MNRLKTSRRGFFGSAAALATAKTSAAPAAPKLEYRTLGKTGVKVTSLGFGCMLASDPAVIERAAEIGINYFDTARSYQNGQNERMVGAALKNWRKKVVITSKSPGQTKEAALRDLDTSLREIGTDYLDIWFLHSKSTSADVKDELLEAQQEAKKAGKIRFAGVSFHFNMPEMLDFVVERGMTDVALASYNFTMQPNVGQAIERARAKGLGVVAMKVMAGGYARIQRGDRLYGQEPNALTARLKRDGAMLSSLKWTLRNNSVDTAIIGMTDFDELDENLRAMAEPFSKSDQGVLSAHLERISPLYCRMCGACSGVCEKGVEVAAALRCLTYADGYGQFALARQRYQELPTAATSCADCSACTVACPNGVNVRERLVRAQELLA
ncbi:MAG: aldo/keto reductase [Bryobacteraceae bacterium]|nr:aldo/keto reductase [Bryobacteraceae bacterium]